MTDLDRYHHDIIDALDFALETNQNTKVDLTRFRAARAALTARQVPSSLADLARLCVTHLDAHFPAATAHTRQVLALAEETGEFVGAYRRWAGLARRPGTWDEVKAELADVVITAYITAAVLGMDLDAAWRTKAQVILTRGWRDQAPSHKTPTSPRS